MTIPIANIYYLLLYAWRHAERKEVVDVGAAGKSDLLNLLAHVFLLEVRRLAARGLAREYVAIEDEVAGLRGKLDIATAVKRDLLRQGRTWCRFDELQYDIPRNRIIKATLGLLLKVPQLDRENRDGARRLYGKLDAVSDVPLNPSLFRGLQSHRLVREYDFALRLARLLADSVVLDEVGDAARFVDFREHEARMDKLFEEFVRNFYALERPDWMPRSRRIYWFDARGSDEALQHLPVMQTDLYLSVGDRRIVLDTKYYANPLKGQYSEKVDSSNLYQLYSYVDNAIPSEGGKEVNGVLLYAATDKTGTFAFSYMLNGRRLDVRTLNLAQDWRAIHRELIELPISTLQSAAPH